MRKFDVDWSYLTLQDLIKMNALIPNWELYPKRLIVILKDDYRRDLFNYVYELLLRREGIEYANFFRACNIIEMISETVFNYTPKFEWSPKEYFYYLDRKKISKNVLYNGTKLIGKKKRLWVKEIAKVLYNELKEEQREQKKG